MVDVGGGVGSVTMALAATHRHLRYVVQDRAQVIEQAHDVSSYDEISALPSDRRPLALGPENARYY